MSDYSLEATEYSEEKQEVPKDSWFALLTFKCRLSERKAINEVVEDCGATIDKEKQCKLDNSNVAMTVSKLFDTKEDAIAGASAITIALKNCLSSNEVTTQVVDFKELEKQTISDKESEDLANEDEQKQAKVACNFEEQPSCLSYCNIN